MLVAQGNQLCMLKEIRFKSCTVPVSQYRLSIAAGELIFHHSQQKICKLNFPKVTLATGTQVLSKDHLFKRATIYA